MAQLQSTSITGSLIVTGGITGSFSGSIAAPGSNTQVLFNNNGIISANSGFVYSSGNVGIGQTSPAAKLDIVSTGAGSEGLRVDGAGGGFAFVVKGGSDYTSHIRAGATIGVNYFTTPPSNGLIVEGNVGIGTTNPGYKLDITAASTSDGIRVSQGGAARFVIIGDGVAYWGPTANLGVLTWDTGKAIIMGQSGAALSLGSNGTWDRIFLDTSGNVGIGTTSPDKKLVVVGDGSGTMKTGGPGISGNYTGISLNGTLNIDNYNLLSSPNDNNLYINRPTGADIRFRMNNNDQVAISSAGNVLIGTTSDAGYKLRVNGSSYFDSPILCYTGNGYITALTNDGVGSNNGFGYSFLINNNGHEIGRLTGIYETSGGGGSGGIGFWTRGSGTLSNKMILNSGGTLTLNSYGSGTKTGTVAYNLAVDSSGNVIETAGGVVDGSGTANYVTKWQDANTVTNSVIYDNGTNIGIGTNNPGNRLTIQANNNTYALELRNSLGDTRGGFFYDTTSGTNTSLGLQNSSGTETVLLRTSGVSYLNGGNVGINTTNPGYKLEVQGTSYFSDLAYFGQTSTGGSAFRWGALGSAVSPDTMLTHNQLWNGSGWTILNSGVGTSYLNLGSQVSSPDIQFGTGPANTAATTRMIIKNGGNVGIGTTSPGYKLDVNGSGRFIFRNDSNEIMDLLLSTEGAASKSKLSLLWYGNETAALKFARGGNSTGGSMEFWTQLEGSSTQQRMVINSNGTIDIVGGVLGYNPADSFILNGKTQPHYGFNLNPAGSTPIGISGYFGISLATSGTERFSILGNGNVGINTTAPQKILDVVVSANDFATVGAATAMAVGQWAGIHFGYRENNTNYRKSAIVFERTDLTSSNAQGKVHILNGPQAGGGSATLSDAKLTIAENGNVGIGTTNPGAKLHISNGDSSYALYGPNASWSSYLYVGAGLNAIGNGIAQVITTNGNLHLDSGTSQNTYINSYSQTSTYINPQGGNVSIGTFTPTARLTVTRGAQSDTITVGNSAVYAYGSDVGLAIGQYASGPYGTWLQSIRTDNTTFPLSLNPSGGNVGIFTSNPGQPLEVNGRALVNQFQYTRAIDYSGNNLDSLTTAGFYDGYGMTNAPNTGWFYVTVETHNGDNNWIHQTATSFGAGNTANEVYTRVRVNSTWGSWKLLGDAGSISGTTNYIPKFTSGTAIGNSAIYDNSGNIGIGTTTPGAKLEVNGSFRATTKSFIIDHPTKEGKKLQYGVLEGPEHSVYVRGKLTNTSRIELPDYWHALVDEDSITVNLTAIGRKQELWVEEITDKYITVGSETAIVNCFYTVFAERKDVDKLVTEFDKE